MQSLREDLRGLPPFAQPYVRYSKRMSQFVYDLSQMMTLADAPDATGLSWDTAKDMIKPFLQKTVDDLRYRDLKHLAIDEIYVGSKKKVLQIGDGSGYRTDRIGGPRAWGRLRLSKAKIVAVAMDMSAAYWKAVRENLRGAAIVFDKFHLVKLVNEKLDELRRDLVCQAGGLLKTSVKGLRYLLLTRRDHLTADKLHTLDVALKFNQPLFTAYYLKEELTLLWAQPTAEGMEAFLIDWCRRAAQTGIRLFQSIANTLLAHRSGILSWFTHRINSGRMEGINNKIRNRSRGSGVEIASCGKRCVRVGERTCRVICGLRR